MRDLRGLSLEERMNELNEGICEHFKESKQRLDSLTVQANVMTVLRAIEFNVMTERKNDISAAMTFYYAIPNQDEGSFRTEDEYKAFSDFRSDFVYDFYPKYLDLIKEMGKKRKIKGEKVIEDMPLMGDTYENCIFNLGIEKGRLVFDFVLDNNACTGKGLIDFGKAYENKIFEVIKLIFDFRMLLISYMKMGLYNIETLRTHIDK